MADVADVRRLALALPQVEEIDDAWRMRAPGSLSAEFEEARSRPAEA
jgi:hypothetical protein